MCVHEFEVIYLPPPKKKSVREVKGKKLYQIGKNPEKAYGCRGEQEGQI